MERRPYFLIGDILACGVTGAAAALLAQLAVPGGWPAPPGMIVGMLLGMPLGMCAGILGGALFSPLFGAMEISLPTGLAGMMAGGLVGMCHGMAGIGAGTALLAGAVIGLLCLIYTYALQARLRGPVA